MDYGVCRGSPSAGHRHGTHCGAARGYIAATSIWKMFRAAPHRFDLVITEQTMPSLTGDALARALRAIRPDIPIILCTGFSRTIDAEKAHALGLNAFLTKPWEGRGLARTVREVLGGR